MSNLCIEHSSDQSLFKIDPRKMELSIFVTYVGLLPLALSWLIPENEMLTRSEILLDLILTSFKGMCTAL